MKKTIIFQLIFVSLSIICHAQFSNQLIAPSGTTFTHGNTQLDWSLGELAIHTYNVNGLILTEGFHQPLYIITSSKIMDEKTKISLFPNPTIDQIILKYPDHLDDSQVFIISTNGQLIYQSIIKSEIDMSNYKSGSYLIQIINKDKLIARFKIQKL